MSKKLKKRKNKSAIQAEIPECWQDAVNKVVMQYCDGWYAVYLKGFTKAGLAIIQPIGALGGKIPHTKTVSLSDLKLIPKKET
jgi:hypothetical protein